MSSISEIMRTNKLSCFLLQVSLLLAGCRKKMRINELPPSILKIRTILFIMISIMISCTPDGQVSDDAINQDQEEEGENRNDSSDSVLRIALIQPESVMDQKQNLLMGMKFCRKAKADKADIVVFPEMYNMGYKAGIDFEKQGITDAWKTAGLTDTSHFVNVFRDLADELDMAILITYLEKWDPLPRNTAALYDRHGHLVLKYSKVHTVDLGYMEAAITPGDDFYVSELDTRIGPVKTGVMICYDREFPESARILMLKGAELILTPNACRLEHLRIVQFQSRAWENSLVTAMANYSGEEFDGHSCAFNADGKEIIIAGEEEGVFLASFNLQQIREYREWTFWGNAYRRPRKYGLILSEEVKEPFIREDAFGKPFDNTRR
jgi:N-carbamoylputrescine amidase